jgi:hypothetical protein
MPKVKVVRALNSVNKDLPIRDIHVVIAIPERISEFAAHGAFSCWEFSEQLSPKTLCRPSGVANL